MANSIVRLTVDDSSFNAKIKEAARNFADFGKRVASAGADAMAEFARGTKTAKAAFEGFNAALKANALILVASLAIQAASAIGEMIGKWITGADDAADAQQRLNDKLEETARLIDGINEEGDFNARMAKAAGASTKDVLQMKVQSAEKANNSALAALMDPNIKVGTEEYKKAKQLYERANKRLQKAIQDQKVDEQAQKYKTGEYAPKKTGSGRTPKPKVTPVQQAALDIQKAEKEYANALKNAQLKMNEGMIKDDKYEKEILENEKKLADAYLKAYNVTGDEEYLNKFKDTADRVKNLEGVVDAAAEAHKAEENAARELANAQKKLTNAQLDAAKAAEGNDLKEFYSANKKLVAAGGTAMEPIDFTATAGNIDAFINNLKEKIDDADLGSELYNELTKQLADAEMLSSLVKLALENGINLVEFNPQELWDKIFGTNPGDYIDDSKWEEIRQKAEEIIGKPISIDVNTGKIAEDTKTKKETSKEAIDKMTSRLSAFTSGISQITNGLQAVGLEIPKELQNTLNVINGLISVIQGVSSVVSVFATGAETANTAATIANTAAIGALTTTMAVNTATNLVPFMKTGGVAHAKQGFVPGNNYSDNVPIMVSSGELILNRAQQGNIASQLEGNGLQNLHLEAVLRGEDMRLSLKNNGRRTGRGEYVTTNFRRYGTGY